MKYYVIAVLMALSACASTGGSWRNHHYADNCGYAMDQEGLCGY